MPFTTGWDASFGDYMRIWDCEIVCLVMSKHLKWILIALAGLALGIIVAGYNPSVLTQTS